MVKHLIHKYNAEVVAYYVSRTVSSTELIGVNMWTFYV